MKINWNQECPEQALVVETENSFAQKHSELFKKTLLGRFDDSKKFCRVIRYQDVFSGTFVIPERRHPIRDQISFSFALEIGKNTLYFIGDKNVIEKTLAQFFNQYDIDFKTPMEFLIGLMNHLIREDVYFLEKYDIRLEELEEEVFDGRTVQTGQFLMTTRKDMDILNNYYTQMNAVGETLEESIDEGSSQDLQAEISLYLARIQSLMSIVSNIKAYTSEIWNLRQTQLADQQNKISTLLTIITTIFLPLTLITGWFGMNFDDMPLIHHPMGYYIIVGLCIVIIIGEILFLRQKKWISLGRNAEHDVDDDRDFSL